MPNKIPLNRDKFTFLVKSARAMAKIDGMIERKVGSMIKTLSLKVLDLNVQIFLYITRTLFV